MCELQEGARAASHTCLTRGHGDLAQDKKHGKHCGGLGLLEPARNCSISGEVDQANSLTILFDHPLQDLRHNLAASNYFMAEPQEILARPTLPSRGQSRA